MAERGRIRRSLARVITDDNLDLYVLGTVALAFTVLGATGISDVKTLSSVVTALLALLAFSQIRSRRLTEQVRDSNRGGPASFFEPEFPADLISRRAAAFDILLVGHSMTRTVQGMRSDIRSILESDGRIRVLVLDPTDEELVAIADRRISQGLGQGRLRQRILATLDELTSLKSRTGGRLEIRVSSRIPSAGFNCLDVSGKRGLICVQHYEYRPSGEAAPVFTVEPKDAPWYRHFAGEAERLWEDGTPWPLSPADQVARARRPVFSEDFGPALAEAIDGTSELLITGMARNTLVNNGYGQLEERLRAGAKIRFVLIDPHSPAIGTAASRYYAVQSPESARERVLHTLRVLAELKRSTGGDLTVRLVAHPVATGAIVTGTALFAEYYTYQAAGEPKFVLQPADGAAYRTFLGEAEALWTSAAPYDLTVDDVETAGG
ncbi:hypothetical protein SAMN04489729_0034 [Amycolatopsis lurida]|uniref:DUF5919 domain-containing protein n=1 Tax=Amycolatopsis lurida NRRL 2430 TaxID=1460371 RepID=A0A2P2FMM4_AMYLU|nr:DUF5919 domain-containing protein [Amycolatopsis lurida]KFU77983.1 hypothetical protein BB31_27885 [Amycolatopsis lurida NRRL 2430]SEB29696.1 hypothetical protein SAMN04489729_0034 [Amycolatopsis lurida]